MNGCGRSGALLAHVAGERGATTAAKTDSKKEWMRRIDGGLVGRWLVTIAPLTSACMGFTTAMLLARLLPFHALGLYYHWTYSAAILSILGSLGMAPANASLSAQDPDSIPTTVANSLLVVSLSGTVMSALFWFQFRAEFASHGINAAILGLLCASVPLAALIAALGGILLGAGANVRFAAISASQAVVLLAGASVLLLVSPEHERNLHVMLCLQFVAVLAGFLLTATGWRRISAPDLRAMRKSLLFALPLCAHSVLMVMLSRLDAVLLPFTLSPEELGVCLLSIKLAEGLGYVPQGLGLALFADFARLAPEEGARLAGTTVRLLLVADVVMGMGIYLVCRYALPLIVPKVADTLPLLPALIAAAALSGLIGVLNPFCQANGRFRAVLAMTGLAVALRVAALLSAMAAGYLDAVPVAMLAFSLCGAVISIMIAARAGRLRTLELVIPRRSDITHARKVARSFLDQFA